MNRLNFFATVILCLMVLLATVPGKHFPPNVVFVPGSNGNWAAGFLAIILLLGALLFNPFQNEGDGIKLNVTNEVNAANGADANSQSSSNSSAFADATSA